MFNLYFVRPGAHKNIVRYHTAWFESDFCYIQMELCDGTLTQLQESDPNISKECSLLKILRQVYPKNTPNVQILQLASLNRSGTCSKLSTFIFNPKASSTPIWASSCTEQVFELHPFILSSFYVNSNCN